MPLPLIWEVFWAKEFPLRANLLMVMLRLDTLPTILSIPLSKCWTTTVCEALLELVSRVESVHKLCPPFVTSASFGKSGLVCP